MKISTGNSKIGKVWNISLPPVKACKGCAVICGKDCYAMKAYKQYPATKAAWENNYAHVKDDMAGFFSDLHTALKKYKGAFFRWHVAGDILNSGYLQHMINIAQAYPGIKFLAFTKQYSIVNNFFAGGYSLPENLKIVFSSWPNHPMENPYNLPVAYMQDGTETRVSDNALECPGSCDGCHMCWHLGTIKRDVVFNKH